MKYSITIITYKSALIPPVPGSVQIDDDRNEVVCRDIIRCSIPKVNDIVRYKDVLYKVLSVIHEFEDRTKHLVDEKITLMCTRMP